MRAYTSPCIGTSWRLNSCQFEGVAYWPFSRCPSCRQIIQRDSIGAAVRYFRFRSPPAWELT